MRDLFSNDPWPAKVDSNELAVIREKIVLQGRQLKDLSQSNPTKVGILRDPELLR